MIPRTLSASSLQVAELCLDRWNAEYMKRAGNSSNIAADTGTAVHGGLEDYVRCVYIEKTHEKSKDLLITLYNMSYIKTFNTTDMDTPHYNDGLALSMKWWKRTDLSDREVLSVEKKETIRLPFNHPDGPTHTCEKCFDQNGGPGVCYVPFNYVMDRVDKLGDEQYEVVDYKTVRAPIQPEDLEVKIQARAYALAVQIKYPNAQRIKVTFDLVRHERVSIWVSRDENIAFWKFLCSETQRIVDLDEADIRPTMNKECGYCVKKFSCKLIQSNIATGGIHSMSVDEMVNLVDLLKSKKKAEENIIGELEDQIMMYAAKNDDLEWETEDGAYEVEIGVRKSRNFDRREAFELIGPELSAKMGSMTLGNLEKLWDDPSLDEEVRAKLKALIYMENGALSVKIKPKKKVF